MKVTLFTCARSVSIDIRDRSVSLFHIIEGISFPTFPSLFPPTTVMTMVMRSNDESEKPDFNLKWILNNNIILDSKIDINFQGSIQTKNVTEIGPVILQEPGSLSLRVYQNEQQMAEWPIAVNKLDNPIITQTVAQRSEIQEPNSADKGA